jgi:hypothetical protein
MILAAPTPQPLSLLGGGARNAPALFVKLLSYAAILPWVKVPRLASHLLGRLARRISRDWQQLYGHPIHLLETFVDPERFAGTSYQAANWIYLGLTTGRGKNDQTNKINRTRKRHLVYPLHKNWRQMLVCDYEPTTRHQNHPGAPRPGGAII